MAAAHLRNRVAAVALLMPVALAAAPHAHASTWTLTATARPTGVAHSLSPQPPASVAASCPAPATDRTITVSWSSVSHATSYVVYRSTTSATAGFSEAATGITTTTWTDIALKKGTYWYAVATVAGSSTWISPMSDPSAARTIGATPRCS
jgi:hypothetical protein